jgi:hypothetical protein
MYCTTARAGQSILIGPHSVKVVAVRGSQDFDIEFRDKTYRVDLGGWVDLGDFQIIAGQPYNPRRKLARLVIEAEGLSITKVKQ